MTDKDKAKEALTGCLGLLVSPALQTWCVWITAWCVYRIWGWYPMFGVAVPTVAQLFAFLSVLRLVRGTSTTKEERYGIWESALIFTFVPLFVLLSVVIFRWISS